MKKISLLFISAILLASCSMINPDENNKNSSSIESISRPHSEISVLPNEVSEQKEAEAEKEPLKFVPQLDEILSSKSGICYDYAALFAGMLRSEGIHTKLVKGYKNDMKEYHAWNEVLIDGIWVIIDTTYDAALNKQKNKPSMYKRTDEYNKQKEF